MNKQKKLYNKLVKQFEDSVSVTEFKSNQRWVMLHIDKIVSLYSFLEVGKPVKTTIDGITRVSILKEFIISLGFNNFIGIGTGFGNIWYYEAKEPTEEEKKKFDGRCLIVEDNLNIFKSITYNNII